jgi:hypothetical protein
MLPASTLAPGRRTPADNQTVRNVFIISPTRKSSCAGPPDDHRPQADEVLQVGCCS